MTPDLQAARRRIRKLELEGLRDTAELMKSMCDEIEALRAELIDKQSLIDAYVRELAADED